MFWYVTFHTKENVLICDISYKTLVVAKSFHIRFDKIDGFLRVCDGNRYLVLFGTEKYDAICDNIRCLISLESGITNAAR